MVFETSEQTDKLDAALVKVQKELEVAVKDKVNPAFKSKYADLTAVWDACREALTNNGVNLTQWPVHGDDDRVHLVTRIAFEGQWIRAHFSMPVAKRDAHGWGSGVSYAKRYTLSAALGIVADDDDDGNTASRKEAKRQQEHDDLLAYIADNNRTTPSLTLLIDEEAVELSTYLKKHSVSVKGDIESAKKVVTAIDAALAEVEDAA